MSGCASNNVTACSLWGISANQGKATDASTTDEPGSTLPTALTDQGRHIQVLSSRWCLPAGGSSTPAVLIRHQQQTAHDCQVLEQLNPLQLVGHIAVEQQGGGHQEHQQ